MPESLEALFAARAASVAGSTIVWAEIEEGAVMTGSTNAGGPTLFQIGSITKALTGTLVTRLAARGIVTAETRLDELLPALHLASEVAAITVNELQTHTSGLSRLPQNMVRPDPVNPYGTFERADMVDALENVQNGSIIDGRGSKEYSNFGGAVLGFALAEFTATPYEELLANEVFNPLGMHDSFVATAAEIDRRAPAMSGRDADGRVCPVWTFDVMSPAGGVVSTIADLVVFARALLADRNWGLTSNPSWVETNRIHWHNGQTGSHHGMMALEALAGHAVIALWDAAADLDDIVMHAMDAAVPLVKRPVEIALAPDAIAAFAGTYAVDAMTIAVRVTDGRLFVDARLVSGAFYPLSERGFFSKAMPEVTLNFPEAAAELHVLMGGLLLLRARRTAA